MSSRVARYAQRKDQNQADIVKAVALLGAEWLDEGPLDGWILWRGRWTPVEIKTAKGTYTDAQVLFLAMCKERGAPVQAWRSISDAYAFLGAKVSA
jgi:hypothetical protein